MISVNQSRNNNPTSSRIARKFTLARERSLLRRSERAISVDRTDVVVVVVAKTKSLNTLAMFDTNCGAAVPFSLCIAIYLIRRKGFFSRGVGREKGRREQRRTRGKREAEKRHRRIPGEKLCISGQRKSGFCRPLFADSGTVYMATR